MGCLFECLAAGPIDPGFISRSDDECSTADIGDRDNLTNDNMETEIEKASHRKKRCPFIDDEAVESEASVAIVMIMKTFIDIDHNQSAFRLPTIN